MALLSLENINEITFDEGTFMTQNTMTDQSRPDVVIRYGYPLEGGLYCTYLLEQSREGEILRCWRVGDLFQEENPITVEQYIEQIFQGTYDE
tara:strand:- start:250 stop:525 length:276 start_codon:yes stop_codon:yes gene_type:complete